MDAWEKDGSLEETNYLADLKAHQLMGKIRGADYFETPEPSRVASHLGARLNLVHCGI